MVIIAIENYETTLGGIIQRVLTLAKRWCINIGLNINLLKTAIISFKRRRILSFIPESLKLNGVEVARLDVIKYLRLLLNLKIKWKKHLDTTIANDGKIWINYAYYAGCRP